MYGENTKSYSFKKGKKVIVVKVAVIVKDSHKKGRKNGHKNGHRNDHRNSCGFDKKFSKKDHHCCWE